MKPIVLFLLAAVACRSDGVAQEPPLWTPLLPAEEELDSIFYVNAMFRPYEYALGEAGELTEDDYKAVAAELGVEVAAIKAVVDIETGRKHEGFYEKGKPLINFDLTMYRESARRHGVNLDEVRRRAPEVFNKPNVKKYGSQQLAQQARLDAARSVHEESALEGTFWGMFQIGGFNWKLCGASSVQDFVDSMRRSEREQLELFAKFCQSRDLVKYIRNKDWAGFALRYNGPGYASRGYHTKMAAAYRKFKSQSR